MLRRQAAQRLGNQPSVEDHACRIADAFLRRLFDSLLVSRRRAAPAVDDQVPGRGKEPGASRRFVALAEAGILPRLEQDLLNYVLGVMVVMYQPARKVVCGA